MVLTNVWRKSEEHVLNDPRSTKAINKANFPKKEKGKRNNVNNFSANPKHQQKTMYSGKSAKSAANFIIPGHHKPS